MARMNNTKFVCLDCETTGLDPKKDRIVEIAVVRFSMRDELDRYESLIDPERPISPESIAIHHITDEMVRGKPLIQDILSQVLELIGSFPIVGHGVGFDIEIICQAAEQFGIPCSIHQNQVFDTLRMARVYGDSPVNSLQRLREHFNIPEEGAHRAMNDVIVNIEVFRRLSERYRSTEELSKVLSRPILLKRMPLGKYKERLFKDVPLDYLTWLLRKKFNFDEDLIFSIRSEIKNRKRGGGFQQESNPFKNL